jgi:hypothetical protein
MTSTYHVGLCKGPKDTLIVEMRRGVDFLSCETWIYYGQREVTKAQYKRDKAHILQAVNLHYGTTFQRIIID